MTEANSPLEKTYDAAAVEPSIYQLWLDHDLFAAIPDDRPRDRRYVIMMPLPNVTGALHMGHAMDNVMQDLLVRWHRMRGDNTLWMPGTDHAGIATQAVVEKRLKELEGLTRHDLGRDGLVARIWQWKDQYQQRIIAQQRRMGCSCDWQRQRFTMDAVCTRAVRHAFFRLFADGLIFRGKRLVNWDVFLQTSVSDDEVYHETVQGHFWHLRYPVLDPQPGEPTALVVATTRPETMLGDTAVAVHPDPRAALTQRIAALEAALAEAPAKTRGALQAELAALQARVETHLPALEQVRDMARAGRKILLPLLNRALPLICDAWAKPELGSGCVKITPAHDANDYAVWQRHRPAIDIVNILNPDGTLNDAAGPYAGLERYAARRKVVADLQAQGLLASVEDREVDIGHSDRSKTPIEPYLSDQWFIAMGDRPAGVVLGRGTAREHTAPGLVQAAIDAVTSGRVKIHPQRYAKTYLDWLAEKRDWPISRQLWWGHRIPVWTKETTWQEADLAEIGRLCQVGGQVVGTVRVHLPQRELQIEVGTAGEPRRNGVCPDPHERCLIDVCLLEDAPEPIARLQALGFVRDADVLDTWFSSALWPFSTLGWPDANSAAVDPGQRPLAAQGGISDALDYYYPGSCLVTGRDIITLWVARMVLAGEYALGDVPFSDVFIHANILDGKGERMSKSKGNGIDPVDIIERYGTDAMRYVLCDMQTGSQDIRLPVTAICPSCAAHNDLAQSTHGSSIFTYLCQSCRTEFDVLGTMAQLPAATLISERFDVGRAFCTKLWNSARFALLNLDPDGAMGTDTPLALVDLAVEDRWILDGLNETIRATDAALLAYNPSVAINTVRDFFWGALCDWYLELIKPRLLKRDDPSRAIAQRVLAYCLDQVLRLLHPMVPLISEYLWQKLSEQWPQRGLGFVEAPVSPYLASAAWPAFQPALEDQVLRQTFADLQDITRVVRDLRAAANVSAKQPLTVTVKAPTAQVPVIEPFQHVVERLANVSALRIDPDAVRVPGSANAVAGVCTVFVHDVLDDAVERDRLTEQLQRIEREIARCEGKLSNQGFVAKAPPAVVAEQRQRLAEYAAQRETVRAGLAELS